MRTIEQLFLLFMIYSFIGWLWESVVCSLWNHGKLIDRGFLNGPYCPIYGAGAVLALVALGRVTNPVVLFFLSAVLTCTLEYITSYVMEKLFHARWWDYSEQPLNINGRVYIGGFVAFGAASVLLIKYINPLLESRLEKIPGALLHILSALLLAGFAADIVITVTGFTGFNEKLRELSASLEAAKASFGSMRENLSSVKESVADKIHQSRPYEAFGNMKETVTDMKDTVYDKFRSYRYEAYEKFTGRLTHQQKRMLRAFPRLRSTSYNSIMPELRRFIAERRKEKSDKK